MAAPQPGPDPAMTVSGSVQKYVTKKKKVLTAEEAELFELVQAAGIVMDQEVFKIIVDLLKMNVAPLAVYQMLKSMCAGHRPTDTATEAHSSPGLAAHSDTRGRNKLNPPITSSHVTAERSSREGSSQRVPRQSSASRMQKSSSSGKSSGGSST
ncbi:mitotic-spindle organizing protein 2B isoform X3 [Ranitomeya variabilis]|uniref:mitotic-spindle organizing protein 2B isoform X3 n=1 Tax=Ranitomeya variabilis TaxID=490064 RepID=UPI004057BA72